MVERKCERCNISMHFRAFWDATQENGKQFTMYLFQCPQCKDIGPAFDPEDTEPNS